MRGLVILCALLLLCACGTIEYDSDEPESTSETPRSEAPQSEATASAPASPGPCSADGSHCCMPDGRVVRPGGCQPSYPPNVEHATERGPDGLCRQVPCSVRCLPAATGIATPSGEVPISGLQEGDLVYTRGPAGVRVAAPVVSVLSLEVGAAHSVVELTLDDGRRVRGSLGHPLADGNTMGSLVRGDALDGSTVVAARALPYDGDATWDILPAGPSGTYWADGVLLGSTLRP